MECHCRLISGSCSCAQAREKKRIVGKAYLVDLAGSERASKSGAAGETLQEAIAINQSLSALGNVINALTDPRTGSSKAHIPYRASKLTHLLEPALGGNSHTVMLASIAPTASNYAETLQTLQYASRAKLIVTHAKANTFTRPIELKPPPSPVMTEITESLSNPHRRPRTHNRRCREQFHAHPRSAAAAAAADVPAAEARRRAPSLFSCVVSLTVLCCVLCVCVRSCACACACVSVSVSVSVFSRHARCDRRAVGARRPGRGRNRRVRP